MAHHSGIGQYLDTIGRVPLLTPEEEINLSRAYRAWVDHEDASPHIESKGRRAKEKLITANLRLVVHLAKKYMHRGMDFEDLIQEGSIGLNRAVEKFDPSKGYRFSTYAYWWIRQALTRGIAEKSRLIHLPSHAWEKMGKIRSVRSEFIKTHGRSPSNKEISDMTKFKESQVAKLSDQFMRTDCRSLDITIGQEENTYLMDLIPSERPTTFEVVAQENVSDLLNSLLEGFSEKESTVIRLRFGLDTGKKQTLQSISDSLGMSREQVRQIQIKVIKKLRKMGDLHSLKGIA